jgi:hypothetical protein
MDMDWFLSNVVTFDLFGANFYPWAYIDLKKARDGSIRQVTGHTPGDMMALVIRAAYERYRLPIIITETSARGDIDLRARWMDETIATVRGLREDGIPLFSMIDWSYRRGRRPLKEYLLHLGLYDSAFDSEGVLRRKKTPLVKRYQAHMAQPMPPISNL